MKRLIFLILLIALSSSLFAQRPERFRNDFYVGFGGGMHSSMVDFVPQVLQNQRLGIHGGVAAKFVSTELTDRGNVLAGIIAELNFSQRGWIEDFDYERHPDFTFNRTLNYIDFPFMTHINAGRGNVRFIFNAGPQISFLLGDNVSMSSTLAEYLADNTHITDRRTLVYRLRYQSSAPLTRIDYGLIGGMGMQIRTAGGHFDIEGRYYFGLGDIFESRRSRNAFFSRSAHRVIQVRVTYYMRMN